MTTPTLLRSGDAAKSFIPTEAQAESAITAMLRDEELASILRVGIDWVRLHFGEIPGGQRFGNYYRFRCKAIERWLGSLDRVLVATDLAKLMQVPRSWIYTNADKIPGVLRLGRLVRFRPTVVKQWLADCGTCQ